MRGSEGPFIIKTTQKEQAKRVKEEVKQRQQAGRNDPRPMLLRMPDDSPLTEEMARINNVMRGTPLDQQFRRNMNGYAVNPRWMPLPNTHAFGSNEEEEEAPSQWTIGRLDEYALTEELEKFMDYVDDEGRSVAPPRRLVRAYTRRDDKVLHTLTAIAYLPIVLANGEIIGCGSKFEPSYSIQFMVPPGIAAAIPKLEDCTPAAVGKAMVFLTDDWLADVATDYEGKCVTIAFTLTIIERSLLPARPAFVFSAGQSGVGKTTSLEMNIAAATGNKAAGSQWSMDESERRKARTTYFMAGAYPWRRWSSHRDDRRAERPSRPAAAVAWST